MLNMAIGDQSMSFKPEEVSCVEVSFTQKEFKISITPGGTDQVLTVECNYFDTPEIDIFDKVKELLTHLPNHSISGTLLITS